MYLLCADLAIGPVVEGAPLPGRVSGRIADVAAQALLDLVDQLEIRHATKQRVLRQAHLGEDGSDRIARLRTAVDHELARIRRTPEVILFLDSANIVRAFGCDFSVRWSSFVREVSERYLDGRPITQIVASRRTGDPERFRSFFASLGQYGGNTLRIVGKVTGDEADDQELGQDISRTLADDPNATGLLISREAAFLSKWAPSAPRHRLQHVCHGKAELEDLLLRHWTRP